MYFGNSINVLVLYTIVNLPVRYYLAQVKLRLTINFAPFQALC